MQESQVRVQTTAIVSSYVPRRCGIATFAKDLRDALSAEIGDRQAFAVAMDDLPQGYEYPPEVRFQVPEHLQEEYRTAADMLNINQVDVTLIQHEYGIYGGQSGSYLLDLIRRLRMPVMSTLHTVLQEPNAGQKAVMRDVVRYSDRLVVMTGKAGGILHEVYGAPAERIVCIPHGIPDVPFSDPALFKERYGLEGRLVLLTFGLLSPGKGIEVVLRGLPQVVRQHPEAMYVVLGATHPSLLRQEGDAYRDSLERMVVELGLTDHVLFHNRYVSLDELCGYLCATDVYVTPYHNPDQITSGTLAYAMGTGRAVVSTPYWHAQELLADGRGRLVPFNDSDAIAREVNDLLGNVDERNALRERAYAHCRPMVWKEVAKSYLAVARSLIVDRRDRPKPLRASRTKTVLAALPDVNLAHLRRLTDDTGILQHANYSIPDRRHGYSADDNARAVVASLMYYALRRDASILPLVDTYLAFLYHAFDPQCRRFRNYLTYDRQWVQDEGSDDVHGRAMWALGLAAALAPNEAILSFSTRLFNSGLEALEGMGASRAWSFALVGIHAYLERFSGDTNVRRVRGVLGSRLQERFARNASSDWPWCEDAVTYDNAKIAHAMILCGQWIPDGRMRDQGLRSLGWLVDLQADTPGQVSLIGNDGWLVRGGARARFDQQPVEAMAMVEACAEAYRCTGDIAWVQRARRFLDWFLGGNDTRSMIYDYQTGGCRDGLHADGPNLNQGAESTLAWLISLLTVRRLEQAVVLADAAETAATAPAAPPAAGSPS
jgi:glycosyltransferase involved in cell wall biosynthesis